MTYNFWPQLSNFLKEEASSDGNDPSPRPSGRSANQDPAPARRPDSAAPSPEAPPGGARNLPSPAHKDSDWLKLT